MDSTRMGLQGHSWGGYEVNFLVTQTHYFAAACSAAGIADLTSLTYGLRPVSGGSNQFMSEIGQNRLGTNVWAYPGVYMRNSPLVFADRVITPLLIVQGDSDQTVPWSQSIEWFTALRRLEKRAWLLEYKGERHTLADQVDRVDLSYRMLAFFDYYLRGGEQPAWMR